MKKATTDYKLLSGLFFRLLPFQMLLIIINAVNGIVDSLYASNAVGKAAMNAIGLFAPLNHCLYAISILLVSGSQLLYGRYLHKEPQSVRSVFSVNLLLSAGVSLLISTLLVLGVVTGGTARMVTNEEELRMLNRYLLGQAPGIPALVVGQQLFSFLRRLPDVDRAVEDFWDRNEKGVGAWYLAQKRSDDLILSASPRFLLQPLCDAGPLGQHNKVVLGQVAAVVVAETADQRMSEGLKKAVPFRETVFLVIKLHSVEVDVKQNRVFIQGIQASPAGLREFKEIAHIGQSGQMVIKTLVQHALTPDCPAERPAQRSLPADYLLLVFSLVRIPDIGKTGSVIGGRVFAHGVNQPVAGSFAVPASVDDVVSAASCRKQHGGLRDP